MISISIVSIITNLDQAFAFCDAHSEPCFERIKTFDNIDDDFVRNYFFDYADDVFGHYDWPNKSDNVANDFDGFPAVYCFEIIANDTPHFLMANWIDHKSISNIVDMYVPELCESSLNPFYEENRPDSLYVNRSMRTLTHSIILPDNMREKTFDEFMDWCVPYYGDKCVELEKNRVPIIKSPLKQIKSGIKFHDVVCKDGLELTYKKSDDTSACVTLDTKIELVVRGWATDDRVQLGCTPTRYEKCYPSDPFEYRKALYDYYFDDSNLPSSKSFDFVSWRTINACSDQSICFGKFDNGTKMRVSCDYPTHGCPPIKFDEYEVAD